MDLSQWLKDEIIEDYAKTPINILITDLSEKYDIKITIQAFKKEKNDNISKDSKLDKNVETSGMAKKNIRNNFA